MLVVLDHFTRWAEAFPMADERAETIARNYVCGVICRHGVARRVLTDQGTNFVSEVVASLHKLLGTKRLRTTAYHPSSNGLNERVNGTIKGMLRKYADAHKGDWNERLPLELFSYHATAHSSLGDTPFFLIHGRDPLLPLDVVFDAGEESENVSRDSYASRVAQKTRQAWELVREHMLTIQERAKKQRAAKVPQSVKYQVGTWS